jgi:hypothetical protein
LGENGSARTERELAALRGQIDTDIAQLRERIRTDLDPREVARRRPIPVLGGAAALGALVVATVVRRVSEARKRRPQSEIDDVIQRLGGRVDKLKKKQRERLRQSIRKEVAEVETGTKAARAMWDAAAAGLLALAAALGQSSVRRFFGDRPRE